MAKKRKQMPRNDARDAARWRHLVREHTAQVTRQAIDESREGAQRIRVELQEQFPTFVK